MELKFYSDAATVTVSKSKALKFVDFIYGYRSIKYFIWVHGIITAVIYEVKLIDTLSLIKIGLTF